jgi:hypothetical protein
MGRMKDFDIRIRNGGDDAIAAVSEYVSHLERKNALLERETALLRLDAGKDVEWHLSQLGLLADECEREFRARFQPSPYLDAVVAVLRIATRELDYAVRRRLAEEEIRWIPVTERLPEEGGVFPYVLARIGGMFYPAIARRSESGDGWIEIGDWRRFAAWEITHWMPLPEPPEVAVDTLREAWQQLHTGPGPSPLLGTDLAEGESWTPQP